MATSVSLEDYSRVIFSAFLTVFLHPYYQLFSSQHPVQDVRMAEWSKTPNSNAPSPMPPPAFAKSQMILLPLYFTCNWPLIEQVRQLLVDFIPLKVMYMCSDPSSETYWLPSFIDQCQEGLSHGIKRSLADAKYFLNQVSESIFVTSKWHGSWYIKLACGG